MNRRDFLFEATALATTLALPAMDTLDPFALPIANGGTSVTPAWAFDGPIFDGELGKYRGVKFVEQTTLHGKNWEWAHYADKVVVTSSPARITKLVEL